MAKNQVTKEELEKKMEEEDKDEDTGDGGNEEALSAQRTQALVEQSRAKAISRRKFATVSMTLHLALKTLLL
ncbi:MAG: hypothetical protein ACYSX1_09955 [Planctomycetota bacterium]